MNILFQYLEVGIILVSSIGSSSEKNKPQCTSKICLDKRKKLKNAAGIYV